MINFIGRLKFFLFDDLWYNTPQINHPNHLMKIIIFAIIALTLTACGQKGALYLPQKNLPQKTSPAQTDSTPVNEMADKGAMASDDPNNF